MIALGIYPLSEGTYTIAADHVFVPFNKATDSMASRPASLLVEIQPFLVVTENDYIIIDAGLGYKLANDELHIHANLKKLGISPFQITKVLLSHLHLDHAGGVVYETEISGEKKWLPTFANAVYYYQQQEWDYAFVKGEPSYPLARLTTLQSVAKTISLKGNAEIDDYISGEICGGHTPFHQVFKIHSNNKIIFYGGDVVPQFSQLQRKFIAKYDTDGRLAAQLREQYATQGSAEKWMFLFFHDLAVPFCQIKKEKDGVLKKD
jgi:glyoxylase-like metal-dependent hydrolase (beta-lactamase superfamily II)